MAHGSIQREFLHEEGIAGGVVDLLSGYEDAYSDGKIVSWAFQTVVLDRRLHPLL